MGATVEELQARMSSREFARWIQFDRLSPIGPERLDALVAHAVALVLQGLGHKRATLDKCAVKWNPED